MKKILFALSTMNIGGVEKSLISLLKKIPKDEYEVTIILLEKKGGFLNDIPKWVEVKEVNWFKNLKPLIIESPYTIIRNFIDKRDIVNTIKYPFIYLISTRLDNRYFYYKNIFKNIEVEKEYYDYAISYAGPTEILDYYILNKINAKEKISWIHFDLSKHEINKKFYQKVFSKFDKLVLVSESSKKILNSMFKNTANKSSVFLNVIDREEIIKKSCEDINFDTDFDGIKILTVGRLSKEKGQDIAINVLSKLKKEGFNVRWYCIGEGFERKYYENLISNLNLNNEFILLGGMKNPYPYIREADLYVQPSRHEEYCLTLAEAIILNKKIVATNFTGANEQLINIDNGFVVDCNVEDITNKIKQLIS